MDDRECGIDKELGQKVTDQLLHSEVYHKAAQAAPRCWGGQRSGGIQIFA